MRRLLDRGGFFMFGLPRKATILWLAAISGGASILAFSVTRGVDDLKTAPAALVFAIAGAFAESFKVEIPTSRPMKGAPRCGQ